MTTAVIQKFIEKIRASSRSKSRVINLSLEEAQDISNELALLLLRENSLLEEISKLREATAITDIQIGGGSFQ